MLFSRLQFLLPQRLLCRFAGWLAQQRAPWLKKALIQAFARSYRIDMQDYERPSLDQYDSFNDFFTRELRPGARPLAEQKNALVSPVDGRLSCFGNLGDGRLLQAKGYSYSLETLLAGSASADTYLGGRYATIYLAPANYHRVHLPCSGVLRSLHYVPGRQFSVNESTTRSIGNIYARNERLIAEFETPRGNYCLIMVGALLVAGMSTIVTGKIERSDKLRRLPLAEPARQFKRGDEFGTFQMGSTVVLLFPPGMTSWSKDLREGETVRLGESLGLLSENQA